MRDFVVRRAVALRITDLHHAEWVSAIHLKQFVTSDRRQASLAKKCGFTPIDPT